MRNKRSIDHLNSVNGSEIEKTRRSEKTREKMLYFFGIDPPLPSQLFRELAGVPIVSRSFSEASDMVRASTRQPADILLLDPKRLPDDLTSVELLARMEIRSGIRPVLFCLVEMADVGARIRALREGATAVFQTPVNLADAVAKLKEVALAGVSDPYRIMVVDENGLHAKLMTRYLESAGMQAVMVSDSHEVIGTLDSFRPDLLLMDLEMPEIRGDELASLIRDSRKYDHIPIVFISGVVNANNRLDALSVGGDEFLAKPVERPNLIATVNNRIKRSRSIRGNHNQSESSQAVASPTCPQGFLLRLERAITNDCLPIQSCGLIYISISASGRNAISNSTIVADSIRSSVGTLVSDRLGPLDFLERLGAFEYAMYATRANETDLRESAEGILSALSHHAVELGQEQRILIKASIGIGVVRQPGDDALALISRARTACAKAETVGGGRVETHVSMVTPPRLEAVPDPADPKPEQGVAKDERMAALIRAALDGDHFQLLYQPVIALRRSRTPYHEVLLRMKTPDGELIPPLDFIPVAEQLGCMEEIDRWVIRRAFKTLQQQRRKGRKLRFFIHQSVASLQSKDWVLWLRDQIVRRDLVKLRPILQFRSDEMLDSSEAATAHFRVLERLGISVCLINITGEDDQLELFEHLQVRKIAKLAVSHVANSETLALAKLVRRIHRLDARVFATGIEDSQTVGRVWHCGFDFIQGNYIQFPVADPTHGASTFPIG